MHQVMDNTRYAKSFFDLDLTFKNVDVWIHGRLLCNEKGLFQFRYPIDSPHLTEHIISLRPYGFFSMENS